MCEVSLILNGWSQYSIGYFFLFFLIWFIFLSFLTLLFFSICWMSLILIIFKENINLLKPVCIGTLGSVVLYWDTRLRCSCSNFQFYCLTQECLTWQADWRLMQCWFSFNTYSWYIFWNKLVELRCRNWMFGVGSGHLLIWESRLVS